MLRLSLLLFSLTFRGIWAATLSANLSQGEVDRTVEILGQGAASRLMRSAEAYPFYNGTKMGVELAFIPSISLNSFGDEQASVPGLIPAPRLFLAKGLVYDLEVTINFMSPGLYDTLSTQGLIVKWMFSSETTQTFSASLFAAITGIKGFSSTYTGTDLEIGVVASRDYVKIRPYAGAGILVAKGTIAEQLVRSSSDNKAVQSAVHLFAGSEIQHPIDLAFQIDLMNLSLRAALFLGKRF